MKTQLLVIGYGNELRSDDGVGPQLARRVMEWQRPGLQAIAVHQLTPELAEQVSEAERVVFVDAGQDGEGTVWTRLLSPARTSSGLHHASDPRELLALTEVLFGRYPEAWLIAVPARSLEFGECLSATAASGLEVALRQIQMLAGESAQ